MAAPGHLVRRFLATLSVRRPDRRVSQEVRGILGAEEMRLWEAMQPQDRVHSWMVTKRLIERFPDCAHDERVAALLHDVGKSASRLSTFERVLATVLGPRTWRWRLYQRHEEIGIEMLRPISSPATLAILEGRDMEGAARLAEADDL